MATLDIIKDILSENLDMNPDDITEDSTFESLEIDSLDMVELTVELEDRCEIELGEPEGLETVGDLVDYIDNL